MGREFERDGRNIIILDGEYGLIGGITFGRDAEGYSGFSFYLFVLKGLDGEPGLFLPLGENFLPWKRYPVRIVGGYQYGYICRGVYRKAHCSIYRIPFLHFIAL